MLKLTSVAALLLCAALALAEPRRGPQQQQQLKQLSSSTEVVSPNHPYLFLTVPRANGEGHELQGFKVVELNSDENEDATPLKFNDNNNDDDDDDDLTNVSSENDDDDEVSNVIYNDDGEVNDDNEEELELEDDDNENASDVNDVASNVVYLRSRAPHSPRVRSQKKNQNTIYSTDGNRVSQLNAQLVLKNAKPTNMLVSREHAGAIMVPDGIIEIEGQSVYDEKTGKTALLVPRTALDAIPDGSVVALVEGSADDTDEARANRVIVRRRRKGSRRNVVRRRNGNRRRRGGNRRRRGSNKRRVVRVYQVGGGTRRRGNRRGQGAVVLQG